MIKTLPLYLSITPFLQQRPDHRLFKDVDWDRVEGGEYAIVDPLDPQAILYLPERDYIIQTRVSQTQGNKPVILATPRDKRPSVQSDLSPSSEPSSKNSPPITSSKKDLRWRISKMFRNSFWFVKRVQLVSAHGMTVENQVVVEEVTLVPLLRVWAYHLHRRIAGLSSDRVLQNNVLQFARKLVLVLRHHGVNALIIRMKVYLFCINAYLSGNPVKSTETLGTRYRLANGLPKMLPLAVRRSIRNRSRATIIIWASLLYVYRAMAGKHKLPDLSSVSQVFTPDTTFNLEVAQFRSFCPEFIRWLLGLAKVSHKSIPGRLAASKLFTSMSSGPHAGWSLTSMPLDTLYWIFQGLGPGNLLREYFRATASFGLSQVFTDVGTRIAVRLWGKEQALKLMTADKTAIGECRALLEKGAIPDGCERGPSSWYSKRGDLRRLCSGRLHALKEAAGKVRLIAIVDIWTQSAFKPLHDFMFQLLKALPADATFDQQAGVNSFADEGHLNVYSYDLKAATETIPYVLYRELMNHLLGETITTAWINLLRERDFLCPLWDFVVRKDPKTQKEKVIQRRIKHQGTDTIRYGTGQPMGALSSWGALALLHHAVVQYSASKVGQFPFSAYRVLGDDIVIGGMEVARSYTLVCAQLGIKIGLPKSFTSSKAFFNFASQSFLGTENLSPFSFADELAVSGAKSRFNAAYHAIGRRMLDPTSDNFFARLCRFVLTPSVTKRVEEARRQGIVHNAVHYVSGLLFGAYLEGSPALQETFQGVTGIEIGSGLLSPGLSLFSINPGRVARNNIKDVEQALAGLRTFQCLVQREYTDLLNKLKARLRALDSLLSTRLISPVHLVRRGIPLLEYPAATHGAGILDLFMVDKETNFEALADEAKSLDMDTEVDSVFHPLEEINDICDMYELPRWILDYQKGVKALWPSSVLVGDKEFALDWATLLFLSNPYNESKFLYDLLIEMTELSRRLQTLEHSPTGKLSGNVDLEIIAQLKRFASSLPELPPEERAKAISDKREILIMQYRRQFEGLQAFTKRTVEELDRSSLNRLLPRRPSEAVRDFDKTLVNLLSTTFWVNSRVTKKGVPSKDGTTAT